MVELDPRLVALADEGHFRVTSGVGGTHNPGSLHGKGLAIDIDHRGVDFEDLKRRVTAIGGRVLDERTRPAGQKVWGGPHFHIELPEKAATKAIEVGSIAKQIERPDIDPRNYTMGELLDLTISGQGFPVERPRTKAAVVPDVDIKRPEVKRNLEADRMLEDLNNRVRARIAREAEQQAEQQPVDVGIFTELAAGAANPLTGFSRDVAARELAGRPAFEIGQFAGNVIGFLGGGLIGGVPGTIGAGAGLSGAAELQRQRLAGEQADVGKAIGAGVIGGGLSALPVFGKGLSAFPRIGINAAIQGGAEAAGSVVQQAIEQGTLTPEIDLARTATQGLIGTAGGGVTGLAGTRAPKLPERAIEQALEARPATQPRAAVVPEATPVEITTPSVKKTIELESTIDLKKPREKVIEQEAVQPFAIPAEPQVRVVGYKAKPATPEVPRGEKAPSQGADAAFYDLGTNPADEGALTAAREALPGYGDENLRAIGQRVRQAYDGLDGDDVIPGGMVRRVIDPAELPQERVQGFRPKPQTPETVIAQGRKLRGNRENMILQGTEGSIIKDQAAYKALKQRLKELPTLGENRSTNLEAFTPELVNQRLLEQQQIINSGEVYVGTQKQIAALERDIAKMQSGRVSPKDFNAIRNRAIDMDLRIEKRNIHDQLNQVHPSLRDAWELDFDEATGRGRQKAGKAVTLQEVEQYLNDTEYNMAKTLEVVAQNDGRIRLDADTEITGATSRVGEKELSPIGFVKTKDNYVSVIGYNENGHIAQYYITPKPNGDGRFSRINKIGDPLNEFGFRGEFANIYKGIREFGIDDIMSRPVRSDGLRTSEAMQIADRASALASRADIMAANPKFAKILDDFRKNPRAATVETVKDMEELLRTDAKLLKKMCTLLGKVS